MIRILFSILLVVFARNVAATTYYVANAGNDSNSGTTSTHPFKTIAKINSLTLHPGDTVLLSRGSTWREQLVPSSSGSAVSPITFGAYGSGVYPVITRRGSLAGWNTAANWTQGTPNVWYITQAFDPQRVWFSTTEFARSQTVAVDSVARWFYDSAAARLYIYATGNPASVLSNLELSGTTSGDLFTVLGNGIHYITLQNLDLRGSLSAVVEVLGSDGWTIQDSNVGLDAGFLGINVVNNGATHTTADNGIIRRNVIDSGVRFADTWDRGAANMGVEDGVIFRQGVHDWQVSSNTIKDWGHAGIYLIDLNVSYASTGNQFFSNDISSPDVAYCRGLGIDALNGLAQNNSFYLNYIHDTTVRNQFNADGTKVYYNVIDGMTNVGFRAAGTAQGMSFEGYSNTAPHDMLIYGNVIANTDEAGIRLYFEIGSNNVQHNLVENNILYNTGRNSKDGLSNYQLVIDSGTNVLDNTFVTNLLYKSGTTNVVDYRGTGISIETFNADNGSNGDVITGNLSADPLFTSTSLPHNFTLQAGSPAIDAGTNVGCAYQMGIDPLTPMPPFTTINQNCYGAWEIGAFVFRQ